MRSVTDERRPQRGSKPLLAVGSDEMNFAEFPLGSLSARIPADQPNLVFTDQVPHPKTGELVTRRLTIDPSRRYGLPNALDDEVILGLIQLSKRDGFADPVVRFTRYELLRLMRWDANQNSSYCRLMESLRRWLGVTLYYDNAWWDVQKEDWIDEGFHLLEHLRMPSKKGSTIAATWNREVVFRSFKASNLKSLDLDLYFRLEHRGARRAFRYLDKNLYRRQSLRVDLQDFACGHVGLSSNFHNGKLKERLKPILEELEAKGVVEALAASDRYVKCRPGKWEIVFQRTKIHQQSRPDNGAVSQLVAHLVMQGVTTGVAYELVEKYSAEQIEYQLQHLQFLIGSTEHDTPKNPGGWLPNAIRRKWSPPQGFTTAAERAVKKEQKRQQAEDERKRVEAQKIQQAQQSEQRAAFGVVFERLPAGEQKDILGTVFGKYPHLKPLYKKNPDSTFVHDQCRFEFERRQAKRAAS